MLDKLEVRYHDKEPEVVEVPEGTRLYNFVPLNPDLARMTISLWARVKRGLVESYIDGEIDYPSFAGIRKSIWNPRLVMSLPNDTRPDWDLSK